MKTVTQYKNGHDFCVYNKSTGEVLSYHRNVDRAIDKSEKLNRSNRNICFGSYRPMMGRYFNEIEKSGWNS